MAIKRRSKNEDEDDEDEEERPRRKSKGDDEDDDDRPKRRRPKDEDEDDEDDDRPRRRKSKDEDEEDEDDDRPKRRKSKDDDDDDDDDRPKRRKPKDEEDEEEEDDEDDDRPKRRKPKPKDDDDEAVDDLEDLDELEEEGEEKSYEEKLLEFTKKKAKRRKELLALSDGLMAFQKQVKTFMVGCAAAFGGAVGIALFTYLLLDKSLYYSAGVLVGLLFVGLLIAAPVLEVMAVKKCKEGPEDSDPSGMLQKIFVASCVPLGIFAAFVLETIYLRNLGRYLKDKAQSAAALSIMWQMIGVGLGGPIVVGGAIYFLRLMGPLGIILSVILAAVWVLLVVKFLSELVGLISGLFNTLARRIKAEEAVEW